MESFAADFVQLSNIFVKCLVFEGRLGTRLYLETVFRLS